MTLLEATLSIIIVSIIAAIITPVIVTATESYAVAANTRQQVEQAAYAMDRIVRVLREIPLDDSNPDLLGITSLSTDAIVLDDTRALQLTGTALVMTDRAGRTGSLCEDVTVFTLSLLGADGQTPVLADDADAHVLEVRLVAGGLDLRTRVMPRVRMSGGG